MNLDATWHGFWSSQDLDVSSIILPGCDYLNVNKGSASAEMAAQCCTVEFSL